MKAQEARELTNAALNESSSVQECQIQEALELIYSRIKRDAEKGKREVIIGFNKSPRDTFPADWLGPLHVVHWDGGDQADVNNNGREIVKRLEKDGYRAHLDTTKLQVSW